MFRVIIRPDRLNKDLDHETLHRARRLLAVPHIILRELDLPFELEAVNRRTKVTSSGADFKAITKGVVPALQLADGEALTEGVAITQFWPVTTPPDGYRQPSMARTLEHACMLWLGLMTHSLKHTNFALGVSLLG